MKLCKTDFLIFALTVLSIIVAIVLPYPFSDIIIYCVGTFACFAFAKNLGVCVKRKKTTTLVAVLIALPALLLAVNNFPIVAFFKEEPTLKFGKELLLSVILCLVCALFEETMFRYVVSSIVMKNKSGVKQYVGGVLLAGAIFGAYHIFNVFFGASIGYTLLQVVYTALIGAMLTLVYDKTQRLWICVLIHFIYNVGGDSVRLLGINDQWVLPEIILTAAVSILVFLIYLFIVFKSESSIKSSLS